MKKDLYVLNNLKEANAGSASAQYNLGGCYANGDGVVKDSAKAVEWFRKAAEQGHVGAQWILGRYYDRGEGVAKDSVKAVGWYRKAAEQGNEDAQRELKQLEK